MGMQKIYMVRHGQSQANAAQIVAGQQQSSLTEIGKQQAKTAGEAAKKLGINYIICSPMGRAQETAQIIAEAIGYPKASIHINDELIERRLGELEGKSYARNERHNGNYPETETYAGVETLEHLYQRVYHVLHQLLGDKTHTHILIVCHQNVGRMLWATINGQAGSTMYDQPRLENGIIYRLI
jgi:broad specificity phosphatase PhoE